MSLLWTIYVLLVGFCILGFTLRCLVVYYLIISIIVILIDNYITHKKAKKPIPTLLVRMLKNMLVKLIARNIVTIITIFKNYIY